MCLAVLSRSRFLCYLLHRRPVVQPHNYMAHIMNFSTDQALIGWEKFLRRISRKVRIASTFEESVTLWRESSFPSEDASSFPYEGESGRKGVE